MGDEYMVRIVPLMVIARRHDQSVGRDAVPVASFSVENRH